MTAVREILAKQLDDALAQIEATAPEGGVIELTLTHTITGEDERTAVRRFTSVLCCDSEGEWFLDETWAEPDSAKR